MDITKHQDEPIVIAKNKLIIEDITIDLKKEKIEPTVTFANLNSSSCNIKLTIEEPIIKCNFTAEIKWTLKEQSSLMYNPEQPPVKPTANLDMDQLNRNS
jgi:hypothetical protein